MARPPWWKLSFQFIFLVVLLTATPDPVASQCDQALGFEDGRLPDSQFSATSVYSNSYSAWNARINSSVGWIARQRNAYQHVIVNLTNEMKITEVAVQSANNGLFTRQMKMFYSLDNLIWRPYISLDKKTVLNANSAPNQIIRIRLIPEIKARFVVFNPVSFSGRPALRLELFGCLETSPTPLRHIEVTNDIKVVEEWIPSLSPYVINKVITIRPTGKLTIQSGVNVIFNSSDAGLMVHGSLTCKGKLGLPVALWSSKIPTSPAANWLGVEVVSPGVVVMEETDIRQAAVAIKGSVDSMTIRSSTIHLNIDGIIFNRGGSNESAVTLDRVVISSNTKHGITLTGWGSEKYLRMKNCRVEENGQHGINILTDNSEITAFKSSFSHNSNSGVFESNYKGGSVYFKECTFIGNSQEGIYLYFPYTQNLNNITLLSSRFERNTHYGILINSYETNGLNIEVKHSYFEGNGYEGSHLDLSSNHASNTVVIENDTFVGDKCNIYVGSGSHDVDIKVVKSKFISAANALRITTQRGNVDVLENSFTSITGNVALHINHDGGVIARNKFINCTLRDSTLYISSYRTVINHNVFINPETAYEVTTNLAYDDNSRVNASGNYWGLADLHAVRLRICDFFCNMDTAEFWLEPIFLSSNLSVTAGTNTGRDFTSQNPTDIGGALNADVVISSDNTFTVSRSILIPAGITLTISANTTLQFQRDRGIFVIGTLNFQGELERNVKLINNESRKWKGVLYKYARTTKPEVAIKNVEIVGASTCVRLHVNQTGLTSVSSARLHCDYALYIKMFSQHTLEVRDSTINNRVTVDVTTPEKTKLLFTSVTSKTTSGNSLYVNVPYSIIGDITVSLLSSDISNNENWVWYFYGYKSIVNLYIDKCSISSYYGIDLNTNAPQINIQSSNITTTSQSVSINIEHNTINNQNHTKIVIDDCRIEAKSYASVLSLTSRYSDKKNSLVVRNSYLYGNRNPLFNIQTYHSPWSIVFTGNTFTSTKTGFGFQFTGACNVLDVSHNTFNHTVNAGSIQVQNSLNCSIMIQKNNINGKMDISSSVPLATQITFQRNIIHDGSLVLKTPDILVRENIFETINTAYVVRFENSDYKTRLINASYNYWDTTNFKAIRRMIYDSSYSPDLPTISIVPLYTFRNLTSPTFPSVTFLSPDGTVGGAVVGDVVLTTKNSPYRVVSNIEVPKQQSLTIEPGVKLLFLKDLKITVQGKLNIVGTYSSPVEAVPEVTTEKWRGIFLGGHMYLRPSSDRPRIRLVSPLSQNSTQSDVPASEGRVEVLVNGVWGTVCDDGFDKNDAIVVCRMLGYDPHGSIKIKGSSGYGHGTGPIHYGNLRCTGGELSIFDCVHPHFSCSHSEDVGVSCPNNRLPSPEDILNDVQITNLIVNNTTDGITIDGNVTRFVNVTSSHSSSHGLVFSAGMNDRPVYTFVGVRCLQNRKTGIVLSSSSYARAVHMDIDLCDVSDNSMYGIHVSGSHNVILSRCSVERNHNGGIYIQSQHGIGLRVSSSNFMQNTYFAVSVNGYSSGDNSAILTISNSTFIRHYWGTVICINIDYRWTSHIKILNNKLTQNEMHGIELTTHTYNDRSYIVLANNTFDQFRYTAFAITTKTKSGTINITNNIVANNTISTRETLFSLNGGGNVDISGNIFKNNTAQTLLKLRRDSNEANSYYVTKNIFSNNIVSDVLVTSFYGTVIQNNSFNNPKATCELNTPAFNPLLSVNAQYNYWGHGMLEQIVDRICGFDNNFDKSIVEYLPFYESALPWRVSLSGFRDPLYPGAVGGDIHSKTTLEAQQSPFVIRRSIFIGLNKQVMIEKGTELIFEKNRGIYVEGQLIAKGSSQEKIRFIAAKNETWNGITFPFKPSAFSKNIRLVGGNISNEGRVEIFYNFRWYTVCDDRFGNQEAQVICTDLGYSSRGATVHDRAHFGSGSGPILHDVGCSSYDIMLSECRMSGWNTTGCKHNEDVGVRCGKVLTHDTAIISLLENIVLSGSRKGLVVDTNTLHISNSHVTNTLESGITLQTKVRKFNLNGTVVANNNLHGITAKVNKYLLIQNGTVSNNAKSGLFISGDRGNVYVTELIADRNVEHGMRVDVNGHITVSKSKFINHENVALLMQSYTENSYILITDNEYINNTGKSIDISHDYWYYSSRSKNISILSNTFVQSGAVNIKTRNEGTLMVKNNNAQGCDSGSDCFLTIDVYSGNSPHNITISTNSFSGVTGKCVVLLKSDTKQFPGSFEYNQITACDVNESAILDNSPYFNLTYNILDNPSADYELKILAEGMGEIGAPSNWWGTTDVERVKTRIFDHHQDARLFTVGFAPILTDQTFDCSQVNNCSGQGECVRPNGCRCQSGWTGVDCTLYDCSELGHCQGNGQCIGPNRCKCSPGWTGVSCVTATCYGVSNCSGSSRGFCVLPDKCFCLPQFRGLDCSRCSEYHWGPDCYPCPVCKHGTCDVNTGVCQCESRNWAGTLCDQCSDALYGPACLPFTNILNIVPDSVRDTGGTWVHVWGHNFPETNGSIFFCKFGSAVVNGTRMSSEHVTCKSPQHKEGQVFLEVSPDGKEFTTNKTSFGFHAVCPPGSCNRHTTPPQGQCLFGGCLCNLPWSGRDCSVKLMPPIIHPTANQQVPEGEEYHLQLQLDQGSPPVWWMLTSHPVGMSINASSGLIQWERAVAKDDGHTITVVASNRIGRSEIKWRVTVPMSYNAAIDEILPGDTLPFPKTITIKGHVTFLQLATLVALVDVKIKNKGKITTISAFTSQHHQHRFEATYFPKPDDSGLFIVDARHPSDSGFSQKATWTVKGMTCSPGYVFKQAYLDTDTVTFVGLAKLINTGVDALENITAKVEGVSGPLKYFVVKIGSLSTGNASAVLVKQLQPGADVTFDVILKASRPLRGILSIEFSTPAGTVTRMRVSIQLNIRRPMFELSPSSLKDSIPKGHQKTFEVRVTNLGEVSATNVQAVLPSGSLLSLVSFGRSTGSTTTTGGLNLEPTESALLVLSATASSSMELGETRGTIVINSDLATASLNYHFYITSLNTLDLKIRVEDEYTYFASDKPLVSGAEITLLNPRRNFRRVLHTTNQTGEVVFTNITEDQYTLRAKAPGHASYSAIILAKMSQTKMTIFLQRIAVKYTWTVTPTTFEDKYVITLDSTFETSVPMPVVTIEPVEVNLIPYEEGKKTVMEFLLTNHGLIRADNVRFQLPQDSPSLKFTQTIETIGSLEANTSLVVPIRVEVKPRVKRSLAAAVCGLKMLYDYYCGGTRTQGSDVTLHRQYPGRPPFPCGGGREGGRRGGGRGGGVTSGRGYVGVSGEGSGLHSATSSSVAYNPVTPLSCNCAKTLIKSCIFAFKAKAGCLIGVFDLATASSFLEGVWAALDTAFACVIGVRYKRLGYLYTFVRCVMGVSKDCGNESRRRRDVSSEIVNEVIKSSDAFHNYLDIMDEIFGDTKMLNFGDVTWYSGFKLAIAEDSSGGSLLSESEMSAMTTPFNATQQATLRRFLNRWNNTVAAWQNGTLSSMASGPDVMHYRKLNTQFDQYKQDTKKAKDRGFGSIFDYFDNSKQVYDKDEKKKKGSDDGVCAKVRVRIVQELVLTRDAFNARLEIENGEDSALEKIKVTINIQATYGEGSAAINLFSIGSPKLSGMSGVDGTGTLGRGVSGSSEWLIVPYSTAAVKDDTLYDIGGRLSYTVAGSNFSVPLLPDTITVKPNPSLIVHYFHEKYVQGDDPMTTNIIEPVVPFTLAVMISNGAYGTARQLKITSAQPEIIENEKGLLISFKIIGAQLGNKPITPSLSVNFGDIESFETKTARWLLTSSLKGKFYNYSATFENINPLGDPQLSVLEKLDYHDLIHLVRIEHPDDDQLDDFLVNDVIDEDELPDALYDSSNGFYSLPVVVSQIKTFEIVKTETRQTSIYTFVNLSVSISSNNTDVYGYTREVNNITELPLIQVTRSDGKQIMLEKNAWLTSYYHDENYLHIFDFYKNVSTGFDTSYELIFGQRNMYSPIFKNQTYEFTLYLQDDPPKSLQVTATDKTGDKISYNIETTTRYFTVDRNTGLISKTSDLQSEGLYTFTLIAVDDGIPPRTASVNVSITVIKGGKPSWSTVSTTVSTSDYSTITNQTTLSTMSSSSRVTGDDGMTPSKTTSDAELVNETTVSAIPSTPRGTGTTESTTLKTSAAESVTSSAVLAISITLGFAFYIIK